MNAHTQSAPPSTQMVVHGITHEDLIHSDGCARQLRTNTYSTPTDGAETTHLHPFWSKPILEPSTTIHMNLLAKLGAACATLIGILPLSSCDSLFHDDLTDCPQGVYVRFYQQTPCLERNTAVGEVKNLHLLAFDKQTGLLANYVATDGSVNVTKDYQVLLPLHQGDFDLVAWSGNAEELSSAKLERGVTKKSDFFFQLRNNSDGSLVFPNTPEPVRYGYAGTGGYRLPADSAEAAQYQATSQYPADEVISIPDPAKYGSVYRYAAVNLRQQALRVNIRLIIDSNIKISDYIVRPNEFTMDVAVHGRQLANEMATLGNGTTIDWRVPQAKVINFAQESVLTPINHGIVGDTLKQSYHLLGNSMANLSEGRVLLTYLGKDVELAEAVKEQTKNLNLPELIRKAAKEGNLNINCGDPVNIDLRVGKKCDGCTTLMVYEIVIGAWRIHSYETEL